MRNKNAQNNGKDGEYGEGKNEKEKRAENRPRNFMETALAACDVSTICNLADYFQVHSTVGMDHGISGAVLLARLRGRLLFCWVIMVLHTSFRWLQRPLASDSLETKQCP